MKGISGNLSSLSITDLLQWVEMSRKSGALFVTNENEGKCFCFKDGKMVFVSSNARGQRFEDLMARDCGVRPEAIREAVAAGRKGGSSFIGYLIDKKILPEDFFSTVLRVTAEKNIIDVLSWPDGSFQFTEELPSFIPDSPVNVSAVHVVFEAVRKYDEMVRDQGLKK